jgi:hypothetical protein
LVPLLQAHKHTSKTDNSRQLGVTQRSPSCHVCIAAPFTVQTVIVVFAGWVYLDRFKFCFTLQDA